MRVFVEIDEVIALHVEQIQRYGGSQGIRDRTMLESALATPLATFAGELLHATLAQQAAAYLYHLARNHPFVDGNKRIALMTTLVFLHLNDHWLETDPDELTEFVLAVATGATSKSEATEWIDLHLRPLA